MHCFQVVHNSVASGVVVDSDFDDSLKKWQDSFLSEPSAAMMSFTCKYLFEIFFPFDGKGDIPNPSLKVNSNTLNIICIDCYSDLTRDEQLLGPLRP